MQHPGLDTVGTNVIEYHAHLLGNELRFHADNAKYALGVLRGQGANRSRGIATERGHRFYIGLDAGTAARIGASNN